MADKHWSEMTEAERLRLTRRLDREDRQRAQRRRAAIHRRLKTFYTSIGHDTPGRKRTEHGASD